MHHVDELLAVPVDPDAALAAVGADPHFRGSGTIHAQYGVVKTGHLPRMAFNLMSYECTPKAVYRRVGETAVDDLPVEKKQVAR